MALTATDMSHLEVTTSLEQTDDGLFVCATCDTARPVELFSPTVRLGKLRPMKTCIYCRNLEPFPEEEPALPAQEISSDPKSQEENVSMSVLPVPLPEPTEISEQVSLADWLSGEDDSPMFYANGGELIILRRPEANSVDYYIYARSSVGGGLPQFTDHDTIDFFLVRGNKEPIYGVTYC